jgi:TolB-like protein/Flp pilus assembly protein TadD
VARCLEKKPADRWQSAEQLAQQLELMATPSGGTTPTMAVPVPAVKPRPRWVMPAAVAAGVLGLAAIGWLVAGKRGSGEEGAPTAVAADSLRRLAVLPFKNLGSEEDRAFTDGLTEEITSRLVNVSGIVVTSRTSADRYRDSPKTLQEIGSELRVGYVLEGSVRWAKGGDGQRRVRVTPQLIRVSDDAHVWAGQYDTTLADIFAVQSQIGERVVQALGVALLEPERRALAERPTSNQRAYEYFLRSKAVLNRGQSRANLVVQQALLDSALALDGSFVRAWSDLAFSHGFMWWGFFDHTEARVRMMKAAVDRAVALAPDHPDSHEAMAYYRYWIFRDYEGALQEVEAMRRQQPTNPAVYGLSGYIHRRQGKLDEALQDLARQQEFDPNAFNAVEFATTLLLARRYDEADSVFQVALAFEPGNGQALVGLAEVALLQRGDSAAAHRYIIGGVRAVGRIQFAAADNGTSTMPFFRRIAAGDDSLGPVLAAIPMDSSEGDSANIFSIQGDVARLRGEAEQARSRYDSARVVLERRRRERPDDYFTHYMLGRVSARLGRSDDALSATRRALTLLPPERDAWYGGELLVAMARVHALVGDPDSAIVYLRNALNRNLAFSVPLLRVDPDFARLRGREGYEALLRER